MTEAEIAALLGRPLTPSETQNFQMYVDIAKEKLEELLCYSIDCKTTSRKFKTRVGYSTIFTGAFRNLSDVQINDESIDSYTAQLWDNENAKWFNSVVFDKKFDEVKTVEVYAEWGFKTLPGDLSQLLAKLFESVSSGSKADSNVKTKRVEDFSVTYDTETSSMDRVIGSNIATINKYSLCGIGEIRHGSVCI